MPARTVVRLGTEGPGTNKGVGGFGRSGDTTIQAAGQVPVDPDTHDPIQVGGYVSGLDKIESFTYFAANVLQARIVYQVPTGKRFYPTIFAFGGLTAGGIGQLAVATRWATRDLGADTYTDRGGAYATNGNRYASRIVARVTTVIPATATTPSIAWTRPDGTAGAAGALTVTASAPVQTAFVSSNPNPTPGGLGATADHPAYGAIDVTNVTENPATAATGVVDVFGEQVLATGRHAANDSREFYFQPGSVWVDAGDYLIAYGAQPATIAYQREWSITGILDDLPAA